MRRKRRKIEALRHKLQSMKTINLELSKQLKDAGIIQDSQWYWCEFYNHSSPPDQHNKLLNQLIVDELVENYRERTFLKGFRDYSAFTADELYDLLPIVTTTVKRKNGEYHVSLIVQYGDGGRGHSEQATVLADALGKMLLWLAENKPVGLIFK